MFQAWGTTPRRPAPDPFSASDTAIANALYTAANSQGSFVPGPGQVVGVMLYIDGINPDGTSQESNHRRRQQHQSFRPPLNGLNGQPNLLQDILVEVPVPPEPLAIFVWQDTNQNGIQDAGEPDYGVTVNSAPTLPVTTVLSQT